MAFCSKCGAQLTDGTKFCPNCGTIVGGASPSSPSSVYVPQEIETSPEKRVLAVFSFLTIFVMIYLAIFRRDDKFLKLYANQSLVALIFSFIGIIPFLGWALLLVLLVFEIIVIVGAAKGRYQKLPLIGGINIIK